MKRILSLLLCLALLLCGCSTKPQTPALKDGDTLGTGSVSFPFVITDDAGKSITVTVQTDKSTVGEALLDCGIIAGEQGPYGMYIKAVNGLVADYDTNGAWWGFYINGESAMTGVDGETIQPGTTYELRYCK